MGFAHRRVVCIMVATFNVLEFSSQGFLYTDPEFLSLFFFSCHVCLVPRLDRAFAL